MFSHVEACERSKQSQKIYCEQNGLAYSTFQYWAKKYRAEFSEDKATDESPGFIPVEVRPDPEIEQADVSDQLHFLFPNGIQVMCPAGVRPEVLRTLLNP